MIKKVILTQTTTIYVEGTNEDEIQEWAYSHTPEEAAKLGGHSDFSEEIFPANPAATPKIVLGGESYIIVVTLADGHEYTAKFSPSVTYNEFFTKVSKRICYADINEEEVEKIVFHGKECFYRGWQPDMVFSFTDNTGKCIWDGQFPEWEH